jgi:hypothetical protein
MILNEPIVITKKNGRLRREHYEAGEGLRGKPMIYVGNTRGVEISDLDLDCKGIASGGIAVWDLESSDIDNVLVQHPTTAGLYMIGKQKNVMRVQVKQLVVEARSPYMPQCEQAHGVIMDSEVHERANVCFCRFEDCHFDTIAGTCVDLRDADNISMFNTHCINFGQGYALRIDKRADNYFYGFEPHLGKVWMRDWEHNRVYGWSEANGGKPLDWYRQNQ